MVRRALTALLLVLACAHVEGKVDPALREGGLEVDGRRRTFLRFEGPAGSPLVLALHGRLGTASNMERLSGLLAIARRERFTLIYPDGIDRSWNDARGVGPAAKQGVDDVKFLSALIDAEVERGADASRVYVLGMSNGGFMSLTLACRVADKLAGVASIAGGLSVNLSNDCAMSRPVPTLLISGTDDPLVPFGGGQVAKDRGAMVSAEDAARFFAKQGGCALEPSIESLPDVDPHDGTRIEIRRFGNCAAPVSWHVVQGGGHGWPGGVAYFREGLIGKVSKDESASEVAWAFFSGRR